MKLSECITAAKAGRYSALEALIKHNQDYLYNLVVRFLGNPLDAEDAVQEILIKMITRLSSFRGESSFRTWLYRITVNHVLNMKRSKHEEVFTSFEDHKLFIENLPDNSLNGLLAYSEEKQQRMAEETKIQCQMGMLLCLERENRIIFILGAVMGIDSLTGSAVMDITPETFRKRLSRSRKRLSNYMNGNCSLINTNGVCSCRKKTDILIQKGYVNPENRMFYTTHLEKVMEHVKNYSQYADDMLEKRVDDSFREHPWLSLPASIVPLKDIIQSMEVSWDKSKLL
ncbi:RNA polymerase sigma factor [Sediminispirochaeta smaragdinae]|uniref:RNA polymerase, sigma-24 subunit, ECF subfamily n=1 Tax=Sediminispirochaeta smaragdinae (strain DSM 11293 / JCM 15392 / SEBR 4228) TaxID=573413 RepID=E1R6V2_SEDSS|nr:RNA polymerase sigma factor [Sediminispirochaeta smaragdinae]ADK79234.1 RNA polymerase, sigma-24 subunit, ECF subfamily [Sediminispirochaeta smaragdinae DSM 11293]